MTERPPGRSRLPWIIGGIAVLLLLACGGSVLAAAWALGAFRPDATERLQRHFGLADVSSPESIAAGLKAKLPIGTPEAGVDAFLDRCGIGKDPLSSCYPPDASGTIVCRFELDPESFGLVKESYGVFFHLDGQGRLAEVSVQKWLTGL